MPSNTPYLVHTTLSETPPAEVWRPELSPAWRERLERMRSGTARRRTLAGLWLLREAAALAGWPEVALAELARDVNGRPVLPGGPVFNISHSGPYVACVVSAPFHKYGDAPRPSLRVSGKARRPRISGIFEGGATQSDTRSGGRMPSYLWKGALSPGAAPGLDVERVRPIDVRRFARFMNEDETSAAARDPAAFFTAWTAREAAVKAGGRVGLARIARVRIVGDTAELDGERLHLQWPVLGKGVVACLAAAERLKPAVVREVEAPPL